MHALVYLVDTSNWRSPLDPRYHGAIVYNPVLIGDEDDWREVLKALQPAFADWVQAWLYKPCVAKLGRELRAMAQAAGVSFESERSD